MKVLEERVARLEEQFNRLTEKMDAIQPGELTNKLDELSRIINGDKSLNVPPLRTEVRNMSDQVEEFGQWVNRAKWVAAGLSLGNLAQLGTFLAALLGG